MLLAWLLAVAACSTDKTDNTNKRATTTGKAKPAAPKCNSEIRQQNPSKLVLRKACSPYHVLSGGSLVVKDMVIEPGVTVVVADAAGVRVTGRLVAKGTAEAPIQFVAKDSNTLWPGLSFDTRAKGQLEHAHINGAAAAKLGALYAKGGNELQLRNVQFGLSAAQAKLRAKLNEGDANKAPTLVVNKLTGKSVFENVSGAYARVAHAASIRYFKPNNRFDTIEIGHGTIRKPYRFHASQNYAIRQIEIHGTDSFRPVLTVEAGSKLRFIDGGHIQVRDAELHVQGTKEKPVTMSPGPGSRTWEGLWFQKNGKGVLRYLEMTNARVVLKGSARSIFVNEGARLRAENVSVTGSKGYAITAGCRTKVNIDGLKLGAKDKRLEQRPCPKK